MKKDIYRVEVEVGPTDDTQLPEDFIGAFVNVYLPATNIKTAIELAENYLLEDKYQPIETTAAYQLELEDIDYDYGMGEEEFPTADEFEGLLANGGYWYGPFHGWVSMEENELH